MRHGIRTMAALVALVAGTQRALSGCAFVARAGQRGVGLEGNDWSLMGPSMSSDSRWVVFGSDATNLVPGDTNGVGDAFLHDRNTGVTERVSVSDTEVEGDGSLDDKPSVSDDGDVIAFASFATNLDPSCPGSIGQIFVRTRSTGTTECITIDFDGFEAIANSGEPHVTADGRFVVFDSEASNLVTDDTNVAQDIFVRDRREHDRAHQPPSGRHPVGRRGPSGPTSPRTAATSCTARTRRSRPGVSGHRGPVVPHRPEDRHERVRERRHPPGASVTTTRISRTSAPTDGTSRSSRPPATSIRGLRAGTRYRPTQAYVRDRHNGTTTCESVDAVGSPADSSALFPELSADGRTISFLSEATNLDPALHGIRPALQQMFVRDLDTRRHHVRQRGP